MQRLLTCLIIATSAASAVACGGDGGGGECAVSFGDVAESKFAVASEMNREGCEPATLEGFDPSGLWYVEEENSLLFSGAGPVRIATTCGESLTIAQSTIASTVAPDYAAFDESDLFWRREQVFNDGELRLIQAYDACRLEPDGTLFGRSIRCIVSSEGEDCTEREFSMQPFGRLPGEGESDGLRLLGEFAGTPAAAWGPAFTANVRVAGDVAYVVRSDGLRIIDITDPGAMTELGHFPADDGEGFNDVKLTTDGAGGLFALVASNVRGAVVVDVANPATPVAVASFTSTREGIHTIFTETIGAETRAYLADGFSNIVQIYDITAPGAPVELGALELADPRDAVHDLFVENGVIYANATTLGLVIADSLADPTDPTVLGTAPTEPGYNHSNWVTTAGGRKISVNGDEGYGAHTAIVDVDPASPDFLKTLGTFELRAKVSAHNIMAFGERAYMAHYQDGVRILDLSDPTAPTQVAYFNTWDAATAEGAKFEGAAGIDVDLANNRLYVADTPRGLLVLDIE